MNITVHWAYSRHFCLLAVIFFIGHTPPCHSAEMHLAKEKFVEGTRAIEDGKYADALEAFRISYETRPKPVVLFNIAMCEKALSRYAESITTFNRFLKEAADRPPSNGNLTVQATAAIDEMRHLVGTLSLDGLPEAAAILIDTRTVGTAPLPEPTMLNPGVYELRILLDGYEPYIAKIVIEQGRQTSPAVALIPTPREQALPTEDKTEGAPAPDSAPKPREAEVSSDTDHPVLDTPLVQEKTADPPWLFIAGIATTALGCTAALAGVAFNIQGQQHAALAGKYEKLWNESNQAEDWDKYYDIKNRTLPADRTGMVIGYSAAAVLAATGTILLVIDHRTAKKESPTTFVPGIGSLSIRF